MLDNTPIINDFELLLSSMSPDDRLVAEKIIAGELTKTRSVRADRANKKNLSWAMEPGMRTGGYSEQGVAKQKEILQYLTQSPDYRAKTDAERAQILLSKLDEALTEEINQHESMTAKSENLFDVLNEQDVATRPAIVYVSSFDNTATTH